MTLCFRESIVPFILLGQISVTLPATLTSMWPQVAHAWWIPDLDIPCARLGCEALSIIRKISEGRN